jgi:hypothetical protein
MDSLSTMPGREGGFLERWGREVAASSDIPPPEWSTSVLPSGPKLLKVTQIFLKKLSRGACPVEFWAFDQLAHRTRPEEP